MAANKFATMLHKNTNRITLILVYAVLEWTLIILLLLNSVFSYLIIKFAQFFGLNPPCFWCARIDRLYESETNNLRYHLGFCSIHQKLAESHDLCEDCSSTDLGFQKESRNLVFSKVERINAIQSDGEDEVDLHAFEQDLVQFGKGEDLHSQDLKFFIDYSGNQLFPFELPDSKTEEIRNDPEDEDHEFGDFQKAQVKSQEIDDYVHQETEVSFKISEKTSVSNETLIDFGNDQINIDEQTQALPIDTEELQEKDSDIHLSEIDHQKTEESSKYDEKNHVFNENLIDFGYEQFHIDEQTQITSIDIEERDSDSHSSETDDSAHQKTQESSKFEEKTHIFHENVIDFGNEQFGIDEQTQITSIDIEERESEIHSSEIDDSPHQKTEESSELEEKTHVFHENLIDFGIEQVAIDEQTQIPSIDIQEIQESYSDNRSVHEEEEVSIGTEIPVLDSCDEIKLEENVSNSYNSHSDLENDFEEEKAPETPGSVHSLNPFHKNWLMSETNESLIEESFDGSTMSEPVNTAEKLKSALKAERKALQDLYSELEEERNANAIAANETMAMINRLQEEKAAMQMEALQYQRMMEEQSEYDQEALQLLNELMMKKENELESYRKKVTEYQAKEKITVSRGSTKTGTSSISWSHSEDDDGLSIDFEGIQESQHRNQESQNRNNQNTPIGSVLDLESSLADFEEVRVSILEQLKVLEEKLFALSDEEDRHFANTTVIGDHYEEIGNYSFSEHIVEYTANEITKYGKQPIGKRLLPLFNAITTSGEDGVTVRNGYENGFYSTKFEDTAVTRFELEKKRIDMEEEVDQLYGRLQALEADREFLKHCIGSMQKGDKGMELLQEILYHLRDLRNVNLRAKNYTENALL